MQILNGTSSKTLRELCKEKLDVFLISTCIRLSTPLMRMVKGKGSASALNLQDLITLVYLH